MADASNTTWLDRPFMARHQTSNSAVQHVDLQWPVYAEHRRGRRGRGETELLAHPPRPLFRRERISGARHGWCKRRQSGGAGQQGARRKTCHCRMLKQITDRKPARHGSIETRQDLHREQRVAAEMEKVFMSADRRALK